MDVPTERTGSSLVSKREDHEVALVAGGKMRGTFAVGLSRGGTPAELVDVNRQRAAYGRDFLG